MLLNVFFNMLIILILLKIIRIVKYYINEKIENLKKKCVM